MIKILWVHNFVDEVMSSGTFMYEMYDALSDYEDVEIDLYNVKSSSIKSIIKEIPKLRKASSGYDIIHAQYGSGCGFVSSFARGRKILSLRGTDWYFYKGNTLKDKLRGVFIYLISRLAIIRHNDIVVVSNRMAKEVNEKFKGRQISVIPDGIDLKKFERKDRNEAKKKLNITNNKRRVLLSSVTDNNPVKRLDLARRAMKIVSQKNPNIELCYMHGVPHNDVPYFLSTCDAVLLTSTHEGWPNIIKEALACNIPFISTDVSDLSEIAEESGICKVVEPVEEKIAHAVLEVVNKIENELMPTKKLRNLVCHLEVGKKTDNLVAVYRKMMS